MEARAQNNRWTAPFAAAWRIAKEVLQEGKGQRRRPRGFTLLEVVFAVEVMLLLTLISYNETSRIKQHALVAACLRYQAIIQRSLWADYALDGYFPLTVDPTLNRLPRGAQDKLYVYAPLFVNVVGAEQYYMRCQHNHSFVGVLFIDSGAYITPKPIYVLAAARGADP